MHFERSGERAILQSLENEISSLWGSFFDYCEQKPEKVEFYERLVARYCSDKGLMGVHSDRAMERLLIFDFGLHLAEQKNHFLAKQAWKCSYVIAEGKNDFSFSIEELIDRTLELIVSEEIIVSECILPPRPPLSELASGSMWVDNREFVKLISDAFEEYGHILFDSLKSSDSKLRDDYVRMRIKRILDRRKKDNDHHKKYVLYHTIPSEYRGLIWRNWMLFKYLPSLENHYGPLKEQVRDERKKLKWF